MAKKQKSTKKPKRRPKRQTKVASKARKAERQLAADLGKLRDTPAPAK